MANLLDLPDEILLEIFEYFCTEQVKKVRAVCKRLYFLSLDTSITKYECLLLNERVFKQNGESVVHALMYSCRTFDYVYLKNDNNYYETHLLPEDRIRNLFVKFGASIREIYYHKTNPEFSRSFKHVVECCPNLEVLSIEDCNDIFMKESFAFNDKLLLKMKTLKIYETQYMSDLILCSLTKLCPNLEELTLSSCGINMHNGVYGKYYKEDPSEELPPSNDVFNYKFLLFFLRRLSRITELNISFNNLTHKSVNELLALPNVKLQKLNLVGCREIAWPKLVTTDVFQNHHAITELNLSHCFVVTNNVLVYICDNLPLLELLSVANCFALSDNGFSRIGNLTKLTYLNVTNNHEVTGDIFEKLRGTSIRTLKSIHIVVDNHQVLEHLTKLSLTHCEFGFIQKKTRFDDTAVKEINKMLRGLKELHVHSASVTNEAFIGEPCPEEVYAEHGHNHHTHDDVDEAEEEEEEEEEEENYLETVFMEELQTSLEDYDFNEGIQQFRDMFPCESIQSVYSISNLRHLDSLNIDSCLYVDDNIFKYSMDLPYLRKLSLRSTQITFAGICYLVQKCPNLEHLDLQNTKITDAAVCILVQALPKLTTLNLKNCSQLTKESYKFIAQHCHKLKALHVWSTLNREDILEINSTLTAVFNLPDMCKLYATRCKITQDEYATRCKITQDENVTLLPYANHPFYEQVVYE